jgi:xanthine dehydrogenase accessory factor
MIEQQILSALLGALEQRHAVALLTATGGSGPYAAEVGHRLVVWAGGGDLAPTPPLGDLHLGDLADEVLADTRAALAARSSRRATYHLPPAVPPPGTDGSAGSDGDSGFTGDSGSNATLELFIDVQAPPPQLLIVGAGHIAAPLAEIGRICDFAVTVLDDRPQYANRQRFPTANRVIAGDFTAELRALRHGRPTFDENTYLVLVTRGHQYDVACLLELLDDPVAYIGMIGSQRRIRAVYELLEREQGIPPHKFDRIRAPVGLAIGAQTPAEIAVCIMAEIIAVARHAPAAATTSLSTPLQSRRQSRRAPSSRALPPSDTG